MAKVVVMPKLGLTMTEGLLGVWHKKEGEAVEVGEKLFGVETDKLTNDVDCTDAGILRKILVGEGETVPCLQPVAIIAGQDEDISALLADAGGAKAPADKAPQPQIGTAASTEGKVPERKPGERILAAPAAKKLAAEKGVDLALVAGTGPKGRITIKDVESYLASPAEKQPKASPMAAKIAGQQGIDLKDVPADGRIMKQDVLNYAAQSDEALEERVPMTGMRRIIAERMTQSWEFPAVTFDIGVDVSAMKKLKDDLKPIRKVSYTDMLIKFVAVCLREFPLLNCSVDGDALIMKNYVNIGVAVALDEGLLVPVIRDADKKGLAAISAEMKQLASDTREGKLSPDALTGGTFTISNLGMFGIEAFSPIINLPEVAILGVNTIKEELFIEDDEIVAKPIMKLSLTTDHRAVDGSVAAQFLKRLRELMENPGMLLL